MKEIYKFIEYDLIDIQISDSMSGLSLILIWSEYEESRITIKLDDLVYLKIQKPSSRGGSKKRGFPFFIEKAIISESSYEDIRQIILSGSLGMDEMAGIIYHVRIECIEMVMEAVGVYLYVDG